MSESRLRSAEFAAPFHGIRASHGVEHDPEALARAYAVKMRRDAVFSHLTAAQLLGLPLPVRFGASPVHVAVPTETAPVRGRGVVGHRRMSTAAALDIRGLRVLAPVDTWITLGPILALPDLVAVADAIVTPRRDRPAWATMDDLAAGLAVDLRARGRRRLVDALGFVRVGSASRPESLLRVLLRAGGLPEPRINHRLGGLPFVVDLAWPDMRFGIEYDGAHHRAAPQFGADLRRQEIIHDDEWLLMRVQKEDLFGDPRGVIERARRRLATRGFVVPLREISQSVLPRP
jgi:very-short-patch-repair endonuclease